MQRKLLGGYYVREQINQRNSCISLHRKLKKNAWGPTKGLRFTDWLRQLDFDGEKLSDDEVEYINNMRMMGKFELEKNAMMYKEKFGKS